MSTTVDARGQACPRPVIMLVHALKTLENEEFTILVSSANARVNVCRTAEGYSRIIKENADEDDHYRIVVAPS